MAVTKKFAELVAKVIGSNVGELLRQIGAESVKQAYAGNGEPAQYALDTLPDAWRDPLATWLRARGLIVQKKAVGSSRYLVGDESGLVKSQKRQQKALEECVEPVLKVEAQTVRTTPKAPKLEGSVKARAEKAAGRMVAKLKATDPEAAAVLNDKLTTSNKLSAFDATGERIELTAEEFSAAMTAVMALRAPALRRAA